MNVNSIALTVILVGGAIVVAYMAISRVRGSAA